MIQTGPISCLLIHILVYILVVHLKAESSFSKDVRVTGKNMLHFSRNLEAHSSFSPQSFLISFSNREAVQKIRFRLDHRPIV